MSTSWSEVLDLTAQLEDLKANPDAEASGVVIETQLDTGRGPVATVIVQRGTLHQGDAMVAGVPRAGCGPCSTTRVTG